MNLLLSDAREITIEETIALYTANEWSSASKPNELFHGLLNSHSLITARYENTLVGLGNAISDGHLVVYYPHLIVHPDFHGKGVGILIMERMQEIYRNFHMQMLTADSKAIDFYQKIGFTKAGQTQSMWIYAGEDH